MKESVNLEQVFLKIPFMKSKMNAFYVKFQSVLHREHLNKLCE